MAINYAQLYSFGQDHSIRGGSMIVSPGSLAIEDDYALLRGDVRPRKAIRFHRHAGRRICDVMWTAFGPTVVLISKRVRDMFRCKGFTGWSTYPVAVYDGEGKRVRDYFGLSITGRAGPLDTSRCKKVWRPPIYEGGPKIRRQVGLFFQDDQWDGSDLFVPEGTAYKIVTARVKEALQSLNIPNVEFERLSTYEADVR